MDEPFPSSFDNFSEVVTINSTVTLPTTLGSTTRLTVPKEVVATAGLIVCSIAICANSVVLAVLVRARKQFGSSVHTLIANQSAIDLFTSGSIILVYIMMFAHGFNYNGNKILDGAICFVFESGTLSALGLIADNFGLVVITLERYFKIVHAIAHRKYFRNWMTKVGVALPWIGGACLVLFPAMGTTRIVNGRCLRLGVWPNEAMSLVRLHIFFIILNCVVASANILTICNQSIKSKTYIYVAPHISSESVMCNAFITHSRRQIISVLQCTRAHKTTTFCCPADVCLYCSFLANG